MLVSHKLCPRGAHVFATTVSVLALAIVTSPSLAQDAPPAPDLPPVEVPQVAPDAPPKPKPKKPKAAAAKPKPAPPAPAPYVVEEVRPADPAVALGTYNPALDVRDLELPPGTTLTTAGPVVGYKALTAMSSTKTATPLGEIPQSIQVVPKSLIDDQRPVSIDEALRNVSGVQGTNPLLTPTQDATTIRGFGAEQWLDGLAVYLNPGDRDSLANVERIEVLKGPNAILYGGGPGAPIGGAINVISKLPTSEAGGEIGFTYGSDEFLRPYIDFNQPLNSDGTLLFRITGEYVSSDSFIDVLETERYSIHPTLTFTNKTDTTLTLQARATRWEQQEYQGLPATGTVAGDFDIRRDLFIGPSDIPKSTSEVQGVTLTADHRFNEFVTANLKARWSRSEFDEFAQTIVGADSFQANIPFFPPDIWALANAYLGQEQEELTVNPNLTVRFATPETRNTLLFGVDYSRVDDSGILTADFVTDPFSFFPPFALAFLSNPAFSFPYTKPVPTPALGNIFGDTDNQYVTRGAYTQIQSTLYDRIHFLGGLRLANVEILSRDAVFGAEQTAEETKLLPRAGVIVDLLPGLSPYVSYSEGLRASPGVFYFGTPQPEENDQIEAGVKFDAGYGLTGTLAVYEINRINSPVPLAGTPFVVADGQERSRGFDADLLWQPNFNWQVLANYAYVDAELTAPSGGTPAGSKLVGVPEHSGRFWVNYRFDPDVLKGWSVGAGVYAASGAPVNLPSGAFIPVFQTESYFTVDAKVAYDTEQFSAALNVKNLTDEEYFVPYSYFGGRVAPGADRTFFGTVIYRY
jgi:iron complex outermembrane receptor protein